MRKFAPELHILFGRLFTWSQLTTTSSSSSTCLCVCLPLMPGGLISTTGTGRLVVKKRRARIISSTSIRCVLSKIQITTRTATTQSSLLAANAQAGITKLSSRVLLIRCARARATITTFLLLLRLRLVGLFFLMAGKVTQEH